MVIYNDRFKPEYSEIMANKMRQITRNPYLKGIRDKIIASLREGEVHVKLERGLFLDEIGEIFRLQEARIQQIVNAGGEKVDTGSDDKK